MARELEAVYEQGVLRPLEPLSLAEHQRVRLTLEEQPVAVSWPSAAPACDRRDELAWLAREAGAYAGQWVALNGEQLVAYGPKLAAVSAAANAAGVAEPLFAQIPESDELPFAGW